MLSVVDRFGVVVLVTLLAGIPLGAALAYGLGRHRARSGWPVWWAKRSAIVEVGIVLGTAPWVWMIMTPTDGRSGVQLTPFQDLAGVLSDRDAVVQLGGNLLVFAALGALLPVRFRLGPPPVVVLVVALVAASLSATLEALQLLLSLGRITSVDDVIVNASGAALASLVSIRWWRRPTA
ncbi:VanZ family protein [Subtercola sp. Z020]|uniref:VanZ family protein n=1 Tax=Subtercola sp. Z020 TaxID=2080582 RepID=UPI000CE7EA17|nr:VanZ family protein [Subtercola sp. Z020]PPF79550.1 VanZ family protein [Subtercola sp. Z020]